LAVDGRQENVLTWQLSTAKKTWQLMAAKEGYLLGTEIIISLATNHQGNTYHQQKKNKF